MYLSFDLETLNLSSASSKPCFLHILQMNLIAINKLAQINGKIISEI